MVHESVGSKIIASLLVSSYVSLTALREHIGDYLPETVICLMDSKRSRLIESMNVFTLRALSLVLLTA